MSATTPSKLDAMKRELLMMKLKRTAVPARPAASLSPIVPVERGTALPLSWAQQRLWFLDQLDNAAGAAYHMSAGLRLDGRLDRVALQSTLDRIVARHEALRTSFGASADTPQQVIAAPDCGFALGDADLSGLAADQQEAALARHCAEEVGAPFDLARGPLVRGRLLRLGAERHVLLIVQHHIISDGWSIGVLVREMSALYTAFCEGRPDPLPPLAIQYADYAAWQRGWLQGEMLEQQIGFWRKHLDGAPALLEFPTDRPRQAVQSYAGGSVPVRLDAGLTAGLRALGQRHGSTLFMTLLAGWAVLLARMSNQDDVVIGTPVANRQRSEIESLIGFFVNTLAIRVDLRANPSVAELLAAVRTSTLAAYDHQDLPFEQVVEALHPARSMSHSPLFQAMLSLNTNPGGGELRLPGLSLSQVALPHATTHFDLTMGLSEAGEEIAGILEFASDLFDAAGMERLVGRFQTLLRAMVADDAQAIGQLAMLAPDERARLLAGWNDTAADLPQATVPALFEAMAARQPEAVALIDGDSRLGYAELNARANRLAHHLIGLGVQPDQRVAICAERGVAMVTGMLAILKAGAAYVPIDPSYPEQRVAYMLEDSAPVAVLTESALRERMALLHAGDAPLLLLDAEPSAFGAQPDHDPVVPGLDARKLAYVIYTSGSTGRPKGVMVEHRSVIRLVINNPYVDIGTRHCLAHCANPAFDAATWEIWGALLNGARMLIVRQPDLLDAHALRALVERHEVSILHLTVGLFNQYADVLGPVYGRLDCLLFGGEQSDPAVVARVLRDHPPRRLVHCYGPTETTTFATTHHVLAAGAGPVPIGRPIANTQVYVLDAHMQPVPAGVTGEIYIGGIGVARGYLNQPQLTAERFLPDPFGGDRLYRTGDLGRWLADGTLEYLGRNDLQLKIRGFRIEPGEIEARLAACPGVRDAVVALREDQPGDKRLVAYVVPSRPASAVDAAAADADIQLWPSVGEYFVYDELIYYGLTNDDLRNQKYRNVLRERVKGKVVVDIGTGRDAVLSRLCVELGAARVYAIEIFEKTYLAARDVVERLGLQDRITVIHGDAREVRLPELADVCVSEIVEAIGGAEGAAAIINMARHLLKPDGLMVPARSVTRFAAVSLPDALSRNAAFTEVSSLYVQKIFDQVGMPFDLRLCIKNFPRDHILSTEGVFEDLDFTVVTPEAYSHDVTLEVTRDGRFDGFLLWMVLHVGDNETVDILDHTYAWFPVYFPVYDPGIAVRAGDRLEIRCSASLSDNGVNPDYFLEGVLVRDGQVVERFSHASRHHVREAGHGPYYQRLFANGAIASEAVSAGAMARALRNQLSRVLPDYMVPSAFVSLAELPLTAHGKLDRRALPAPDGAAAVLRAYAAPHAGIETTVAALWQDLLGVAQVGRNDHFFEIGGHSLVAAQMVSRLRVGLRLDIPLRQVFANPVLADFARVVAGAGSEQRDEIVAADRDALLPLSWAQQRLWFLDRVDSGAGGAYHMPVALRLDGRLDGVALKAALDDVVKRHESLRTCFIETDGVPRQVIAAPDAGFTLEAHDLSALPADQREQALALRTAEEARRPFDLGRGPLIRGQLLRLGQEQHVLLVTQHHIVSDAWSVGVLVSELSQLYAARCLGQDDPLAPLALQYADYASWQRARLCGTMLDKQLRFWKGQLAGAPALLTLPTDRARPALQSYAGASVPFTLDAGLTARLRALSHGSGATMFMTLLAGWAVLMARLSGQSDVVVGAPVGNRPRPEFEGMIGFFVNTLALRVNLQDDPSVTEALARVAAGTLAAYDHQELPFEQVVEALNPERSMSHSPLFQVMLSLNNAPAAALGLPGLRLSALTQEIGTAQFDLSMSLTDGGELVSGHLKYATALFDHASAQRICAQFATLLGAMVAAPAQRISCLPLQDGAARAALLANWSVDAAAEVAAADERTIHALFEAQVRATPDAPALMAGGTTLGYAELNRRANQLAHQLAALGAGPDVRIALCLERGIDEYVGVLGILKAGAAYVPLDPADPVPRLAHLLDDSAPLAIVTQRSLAPLMTRSAPGLLQVVLDADADAEALARQPQHDPVTATQARHLAYIIYTSGSTGQPKGVMVEHGSVVNLWRALARSAFAACSGPSRVALNARLSFDGSVKMLVQLLSGHCLVPVPAALRGDGSALVDFLFEHRADVFDTTPAQLELMLAAGLEQRARTQPKTVLVGGEAIPRATWRKLRRAPGLDVFNVYGPTECTVDATIARIRTAGDTPHIGRPVAGARVYLLDRNLQPVPQGVSAEICIGGAGVARGYLNRPDLSAQRFVHDPFAGGAGARMYRTGDLGRWLDDGRIEYLGRSDFQVKLRGYRIELGEIEARLAACEGVRGAVVLAREDRAGDRRLAAYVLARDGATPRAAALRSQLLETLPDYMVPSAFVVLDAFPLGPNGKLDRAALPAPEHEATASAEYVPAQGETELALAAIWAELLGVERVGRNDHFFALGGHSLLAVQLAARVRSVLGVELPLRELFAHPTLAALAAVVAQGSGSAMDAIVPVARDRVLPLSWAQQRLWFLDRLEPEAAAAYHMPYGLRLRGRLDDAALQRAFDRIVARHESLRTVFGADQPAQLIAPADCGVRLVRRDLRAAAPAVREQEAARIGADAARRRFDLARGPLLRVELLRMDDEEHILLVVLHHIVSDGWSTGVLVRELAALYGAFSQGFDDPLPPLALQYADYAAWQRGWLQGGQLRAQADFWKGQLGGAPALLDLPTDRPRPARRGHAGASVDLVLPAALAGGVRALSQRHGTTLFMTVLAAWAALLARVSGQDDIVVGTPVANRQRSEVEALIGFFVNTLALRVRLEDDPSAAELLGQVRQTALAAFAHQDLPFEQVVDAVRPARSMGHAPLFQVMLVLNNTPQAQVPSLPGLELAPLALPHASAKYDLTLALTESGGAIAGTLEYATELFDHASIERLAGCFVRMLAAIVADEHMPLSQLQFADPGQRRLLLERFNPPELAPVAALAGQQFEARVRAAPQATALDFDGALLSYAELNRNANRLAHYLIGRGVRPGQAVAVCAARGAGLVTAMLAVLKAGAAYVPLDPGCPAARIGLILADCAPAVVLAEEALSPLVAGTAQAVVLLDGAGAVALDGLSGADPDPHALGLSARDPAYVIYTSGSTGVPKGVAVCHDSLCALAHAQIALYGVTPHSRVLQFVAVGFDVCIAEVTMALFSGAVLCLARQEALLPGAPLAGTVRRSAATHLSLPVAVLAALGAGDGFETVGTLIVGGDVLPPALARRWAQGRRLFNAYGPTETTVCATSHLWQDGAPDAPVVPIGRPLAHARIYILDAFGQPAPLGVVGEIHIGGAGVARGYLNRDALTAERFLPDPFSSLAGARMYRSGDLGRWLEDGSIVFCGRNDQQLKVRGFRIEPAEIEARLRDCEGVEDALVVTPLDAGRAGGLLAYVAARSARAPAPAVLRARLAAVLPEYMVPGAFVMVEHFPLTANGKVDRAALPAPDDTAYVSARYRAPQGVLETCLAAIWSELLGCSQVGRDDHFFELGGHSLLAVQVASRLRQELGIELALRDLFTHPTLAALAARLESGETARNLVAVRPEGDQRPLFLVHPGEGEIGYVRDLAPWLGAGIPVYALAASGLLAGETPAASIDDMARCYVAALRTVQPAGPYRLAGWSVGGTIAYEMANQLIGADEDVEFVGLIDTTCRYPLPYGADGAAPHPARLLLDELGQGMPEGRRVAAAALAEGGDLAPLLALCQESGLLPEALDADTLERHLKLRHAIRQAAMHYVRSPLSQKVTLFAAERSDGMAPGHEWKAALGGAVEVVTVGGSHRSIVAMPHVQRLGMALTAALATCGATAHPERDYAPRITIQNGRAGTAPLFCVPGAGASVTMFAALAQVLDPAIPVHGLQPRGLCGALAPHTDVQSTARAYVKALRAAAPQGPYHLLGHSFGGWVATEMARQLTEAGERVASLVVLDSDAPGLAGRKRYSRIGALVKLVELFDMNLERPMGLSAVDFAGLDHESQLALLLNRLIEAKVMPPRTSLSVLRGIVRVFAANLNTHYLPQQPYLGPLHVVAAGDADPARGAAGGDPDTLLAGWRRHAPAAHLRTAAGNHMNLLSSPHVEQLATWLHPLLKEIA